ncbi:MAG: exosortase/archaeosortase family protein [Paludibacteraceae bacterium]|nr:exosortase/archaeosortase family protein [Paludibacteraceae bacterium]
MAPYRDILLFVVVLFASNYFWKLTVDGDETVRDSVVTWLGMNVTAPFDGLSHHIARVVYCLVSTVRDTISIRGNVLIWETGSATSIAWSCTAIKQTFIWLCVMLFASGPWKHKLWFIPLGVMCLYAFNILRITLITLVIEFHPEYFHVLHAYVFKYLFYGFLFALWAFRPKRAKCEMRNANVNCYSRRR